MSFDHLLTNNTPVAYCLLQQKHLGQNDYHLHRRFAYSTTRHVNEFTNHCAAAKVSFGLDELKSGARQEPFIQFDNGNHFDIQTDGNLVYYFPDRPVWASQTFLPGADASKLLLRFQADGNLVLYYDGRQRWATDTANTGRRLVITDTWPYLVILNDRGNAVFTAGQN